MIRLWTLLLVGLVSLLAINPFSAHVLYAFELILVIQVMFMIVLILCSYEKYAFSGGGLER